MTDFIDAINKAFPKQDTYVGPEDAPSGAVDLAMRVAKALHPLRLGRVSVVKADGPMPLGVRHLMGTEDANNRSARTQEERLGRCFELSGWAIASNFGGPSKMRLVHGSIQGKMRDAPPRIGHGWLTLGDLAWEPSSACFYDREEFYDFFGARDEVSYTRGQAARNLYATGHFGAWHETRYPTYSGPRYFCLDSECSYETDNLLDIKNHAAVLGHFGWADRQKLEF